MLKNGFSCKYTVRDIGFTDLGNVEYHLYFYTDNNTPRDLSASFEKLAYAGLLDANVEAQTININRHSADQRLKYITKLHINTYPAAVLVSPDDDAIHLPFSFTETNYNENLWHLIEKTVSSPMRKKIKEVLKTNYGAVLLIESSSKAKNERAKAVVKAAVKNIAQIMKLMPKPIENPPQMIILYEKERLNERVLLWSLKADSDSDEPQLAVLFGRGRRMGNILKGREITRDNLFSLLAIVGADCECGLDRSIMLGKMIPLRWDKESQAQMARQLGFDVENPMIKSEMSQILSIAPGQKGKKTQNPLSVYKEGIVKFDSLPPTPIVSSGSFRAQPETENASEGFTIIEIIIYAFAVLVLIVLFTVYFILKRSKKERL